MIFDLFVVSFFFVNFLVDADKEFINRNDKWVNNSKPLNTKTETL
jgi:hypothetical protein